MVTHHRAVLACSTQIPGTETINSPVAHTVGADARFSVMGARRQRSGMSLIAITNEQPNARCVASMVVSSRSLGSSGQPNWPTASRLMKIKHHPYTGGRAGSLGPRRSSVCER